MKPLAKYLSEYKSEYQPHKTLDEKTVLYATGRVIAREYGRRGEEYIKPYQYRNACVYLKILRSVWASEIWMQKETLLQNLNNELGSKNAIKSIKISQE